MGVLSVGPYLWLSNRSGMKVCQPPTKLLHYARNLTGVASVLLRVECNAKTDFVQYFYM